MITLEKEMDRLADKVNADKYTPRRRGDGETRLIAEELLRGPVRIGNEDTIKRIRTYFFNAGLKLTVVLREGKCELAIRREKE